MDDLKMKPGRQLDALIAEKVMGWKCMHYGLVWYPPNLHPEQNALGYTIPHYSTDINAAWDVVQKIKDMNDANCSRLNLSESRHKKYTVDPAYWVGALLGGVYRVCGESHAHAVCLAALEAVGYELSKDEEGS